MPKKVVKKRKIKIKNFLLVILIMSGLVFGVYKLLEVPVKNIVIKNTNYLEDDWILEKAKIKDYPKFIVTSSSTISKRLESSPYIEKATLHKKQRNCKR